MKRSEIEITESAIAALPPFARNARIRKKQIKQIARSIERFGFTNPVLVSDQGEIIAGAIAASATVETDAITIDPDRLLQLQAALLELELVGEVGRLPGGLFQRVGRV